ncbi:MAG: B12-binding domain-containing radical SAM protein [Polyangiaceae bacterium]|nr:B12-binding domain-containing radical SAM protein [Polyangiaceae bacterium]
MKIHLINPGQLPDAGEDQFAGRIDSAFFRARPFSRTYFGIPLALPTLAAVTPPEHTVRITDEMVEDIDFDEPCDLVGLSAMTCKATRAYQIARKFRERGVPVVMGGIHASMCPDEAARHVDCVVVGEADELWPRILADLARGTLRSRYAADTFPDISVIPPPRHELTPHSRYYAFFLQTTRGCPRSCRFCTVTAINGRELRRKRPDQVVDEVRALLRLPNPLRPVIVDRAEGNRRRRLATGAVFFVDDNFAIDRDHALDVCRALKALQDQNDLHLPWFTQTDSRTGFDDELLDAMKSAGCMNLFVGFESLLPRTLRAMAKNVNAPERYAECIANIERHGIEVTASVIVGTDAETATSGAEMVRFALENRIFYFFPNILTPYPGTALMQEMDAEGRILLREPELYNIRNVVFAPKRMSPLELQSSFVRLCGELLSLDRLVRTAETKLEREPRYRLTWRWRLIIGFAFSLTFVALTLTGRITFGDLLKLLYRAPRMILVNGSPSALGFIVNSVGFGTFARSEIARLPRSPAATRPELRRGS